MLKPENDRHWYALYTRPRFEKKVDLALKQKDVHAFLPRRVEIRQWSNGKRKVEEPLFPSYIFVHIDKREYYPALQTYGVTRFVGFNGKPSRIPEQQIQAIHQILEHGYIPEPHQYLRYGDLVEIIGGALKGLRGYYVEDKGKNRLVISVAAIQQAIAVEVKKGQVKKIQSAADRRDKSKYLKYV